MYNGFLGDVSFNCIFSWYSSSTPKYTSIYILAFSSFWILFFSLSKVCACIRDCKHVFVCVVRMFGRYRERTNSFLRSHESKRRQTQHRLLDTSYQMGGQTEWAHTLFKYCVVKQIWYHHLCINDSHIVWQTRKPSRFFFFLERLSSYEHKTKQYPAIWLFTFWLSKNYICVWCCTYQQRWTSKLIFSFAIHCSFIHSLTHSFTRSAPHTYTIFSVCVLFCLFSFIFYFNLTLFFSRFCLLFQY